MLSAAQPLSLHASSPFQPLQRSTIFPTLGITKPVACLSPGPPHPLPSLPELATPPCTAISTPLGLYESRLCCFFPFVAPSDSMCSIPPHSPPPISFSFANLFNQGLSSVSFHRMSAPWGSHPSLCEMWLIPISDTLRTLANLCSNHNGD